MNAQLKKCTDIVDLFDRDIEKQREDSGSMDLLNEFTQELQRYKSRDFYLKTHPVIVANGDPKFNEYLFAPQHIRELERRFVMANVTPKTIRQKDTFKSALSLLVEHHHVMHDDCMIMLNPVLLT